MPDLPAEQQWFHYSTTEPLLRIQKECCSCWELAWSQTASVHL